MPAATLSKSLPAVGTHFYVTNPALARERLRGSVVEFKGTGGDKWECQCGKMRVLFAPDELQPVPALQKNDWVKVLPRVQTHKKHWGEEYPVSRAEGAKVWILDDNDLELELALYELEPCERTDLVVGDRGRAQKRIELENRIKLAFADMMEALGEVLRLELWRDARDPDGNPYDSPRQYLQGLLSIRKNQANDYLAACQVWDSLTGVPVADRPTSVRAARALTGVPVDEREEILTTLAESGQTPTEQNIREIYRPASDPETIRQGLEEGWIQPTDADNVICGADGQPILPEDHIAYASSPTRLLGRVTAISPDGRVEYTRMGKTLYADASLVVQQRNVASPAPAPRGSGLNAPKAESPTKNIEAVTGDSKGVFARGDLVKVGARFFVVGRVSDRGNAQLLGWDPETLSYWSDGFEDAPELAKPGADPLGLTLEAACKSQLTKLIKAFGAEMVIDTLGEIDQDFLES